MRPFFNLLLMNNLFSQLNSFYEDWEPRLLNFPENSLLQYDTTSNSNVTINFNISNILGEILPSHLGTNLTHFLGESVLNQADFMGNIKGLNNFTFRYPGGNGSNQFFWDGNLPSSILNDSQITINDLLMALVGEQVLMILCRF